MSQSFKESHFSQSNKDITNDKTNKLTARQRLDLLFDDGKYIEYESFATSRFGVIGKKKKYGDGVIVAVGNVNGKTVFAGAQDATVVGGSGGETHVNKIIHGLEKAYETGNPFVLLADSGGARIDEGLYALDAYSKLFKLAQKASGIIPQIAAIMGNCAGGSSYYPAMCDFVLMTKKNSQLFITGPKVIAAMTGESITMDELGGEKVHANYSGQVCYVAKDDRDCIMHIKRMLEYLSQDLNTICDKSYKSNYNFFPESSRTQYDVRNVINNITDKESFFELFKEFAPNIVIGYGTMNGKSVGIIANQPNCLSGAINCDAADKASRFIRTCDCFGIPLVVLVDVPGFLPGKEEEKKGILRHGCKLLYSFAEAEVPKVTVILRKAYGGAYCAMNSKGNGADYVFAWPSCEIAVMGAEAAVEVIEKNRIKELVRGDSEYENIVKEYEEKYITPVYAASCGMVDEIISPEETGEKLRDILEVLNSKCKKNRKHGNIAL